MKEKLEEFLKAEGVYEKFVHNLSTRDAKRNTFDKFISRFKDKEEEAINSAFVFAEVAEDYSLWYWISKKWQKYCQKNSPKLIFQKGKITGTTIRQMPENYLIAHFHDRSWRCEPDLAADKSLCMKVFEELLNFESKYNPDGDEIINKIGL